MATLRSKSLAVAFRLAAQRDLPAVQLRVMEA